MSAAAVQATTSVPVALVQQHQLPEVAHVHIVPVYGLVAPQALPALLD